MTIPIKPFRPVAILLLVSALCSLAACSGGKTFTEKSFVGKWKSSRAVTPVYLYENGEWEIKSEEGVVLQYGVWQLKDRSLLWTFKFGPNIGHDLNPILSVTPREFKIRESDKSTTTFTRLD